MIKRLLMFFFAAALLLTPLAGGEAKTYPPAKFKDTCNCVSCHYDYRWDVKTDEQSPPANVTAKIIPSDIGTWKGPGGIFHRDTARKGKENQWYTLTGRVSLVKIEPDGDLHIQLVDKDAKDTDINVVVEVPFGEPWCEIRQEVFTWTKQTFPFQTQGKKFTLQTHPIITVIGKAFYDAVHGRGDTSLNRRPVPKNAAPTTRNVSIWEIHPVMKLSVEGQ